MAVSILHQGATVMCDHAGTAQPTSASARVSVSGQAVVTLTSPYTVSGCSLSSSGSTPFCITAQWVTGAQRVFVDGAPVLIQSGKAVCSETGGGLTAASFQTRVTAT